MNHISVVERRNKILELLNESGRVNVNDLSKMFNVSSVIIRSDIAELEKQDLLSRVYGGAITSYKPYFDMSLIQRTNTNVQEKEYIAKKVGELIKDNSTVIMNAGTTPLFILREIENKAITIVTNSIVLALEGAKKTNLRVILLGGDVDSKFQFTYGIPILQALEQYYADYVVLSVDGVDVNKGISTFYYQEVEICKKMMQQARHVIVATDYTKVGRSAFATISPINDVNTIVSDDKISPDYLKKLKAKGIEVIT